MDNLSISNNNNQENLSEQIPLPTNEPTRSNSNSNRAHSSRNNNNNNTKRSNRNNYSNNRNFPNNYTNNNFDQFNNGFERQNYNNNNRFNNRFNNQFNNQNNNQFNYNNNNNNFANNQNYEYSNNWHYDQSFDQRNFAYESHNTNNNQQFNNNDPTQNNQQNFFNNNPSNNNSYNKKSGSNNQRNRPQRTKKSESSRPSSAGLSEGQSAQADQMGRTSQKSERTKVERQKSSATTIAKKVSVAAKKPAASDLTRSEILIDQIKKNKCECMVCCQNIRGDKAVWSCDVCFHIFHLYCVKKWANSPAAKIEENSDKWRCPGCQTIHLTPPLKYTCFCGKKTNPEMSKEDECKPFHLRQLPHSCGDLCGKQLIQSAKFWLNQPELAASSMNLECKHKCTQLCHPGPCQPCDALVTRSCNCGKNKFQVKCSSSKMPICDKKCEITLNCGIHFCERICHSGVCGACQVDIEQTCCSHGTKRFVKCGSNELVNKQDKDEKERLLYKCGERCDKLLSCGNHRCAQSCHSGPCQTCSLMPSKLNVCPCGKTPIRDLLIKNKIIRTSCADAVPTCGQTCEKLLHVVNTARGEEIHVCEKKCHVGECSACEREIEVNCRCGKEIELVECRKRDELVLCKRRCQKKKTCGRHQCNEICCSDKDHLCTQVCNKILNCGLHKCEQLCHKGICQRCLVASFDERICECGSTIQYPPIRCGEKHLECNKLCTRAHNCEHPVTHNCHWEEKCPPCTFLTSKTCMGNHELRHNIPCYMKDVSCGRLCEKPLANCSHKCNKICHKGLCLDEGEQCVQACQKERPHCVHACNEPCHFGKPCPDTVCQTPIVIKCKCGLKSKQVKCMQRMYEPDSQVLFENLASEIKEMLSCRSIDISTFKNQQVLKKRQELACDEECLLAERNKALAQALQIDSTQRPKAMYSDFLKNFAREDPNFTADIEKKFEAIVKEMKQAKVSKKAFNMPMMKSNDRRFVHELASYYGLDTVSNEPEPYRNVCVHANRDKCVLPTPSLTQSVEIKPKIPRLPTLMKQLNQASLNPIQSNLKVLQSQDVDLAPPSNMFSVLADQDDGDNVVKFANKDKVIDYFDMTG